MLKDLNGVEIASREQQQQEEEEEQEQDDDDEHDEHDEHDDDLTDQDGGSHSWATMHLSSGQLGCCPLSLSLSLPQASPRLPLSSHSEQLSKKKRGTHYVMSLHYS